MVNTAFFNYLDQIDNLIETIEFPILKIRLLLSKPYKISLNVSKFDSELLTALRTLKDFFMSKNARKIFLFGREA